MTTGAEIVAKELTPGSCGWTVDEIQTDAFDPVWNANRLELIDGVISTMAPAYFDGCSAPAELIVLIRSELIRRGIPSRSAVESDLILSQDRILRPDAIVVTLDEIDRSRAIARSAGRVDQGRQRFYVPPSLVIESLSYGHERHDRVLKANWYWEFGVPNYWIVDAMTRTVECFKSSANGYVADARLTGAGILKTGAFGGLELDLTHLWM